MISIDILADILNKNMDDETFKAMKELYDEEQEFCFDPEHPILEIYLERVASDLNEEIDYGMDEDDD